VGEDKIGDDTEISRLDNDFCLSGPQDLRGLFLFTTRRLDHHLYPSHRFQSESIGVGQCSSVIHDRIHHRDDLVFFDGDFLSSEFGKRWDPSVGEFQKNSQD
jgi:hypothetical protein